MKMDKSLGFSIVKELIGHEIINLSGTNCHCLAVSRNGTVFGCGSNDNGRMGFEARFNNLPVFTEIFTLNQYKIRAAYAGCLHSLFETSDGQILSCGCNENGQFFLKNKFSKDVYLPNETKIIEGATFCVAGYRLSAVFIGINPPPNMPNMKIK